VLRSPAETARICVLVCLLLALPPVARAEPHLAGQLVSSGPASDDWRSSGGDLANTRYSSLEQINTANVVDLKGVWLARLGSGRGSQYRFEAEPIVVDGTMYLSTGNDDVFALDARSGRKVWEFTPNIDPTISTLCCGWVSRGVAVGDGLVFAGLLDGSLVALDQQTGVLSWRTELEDWRQGYSITSAPRYSDGLVFTGLSGGEFGARGRIYALDAESGKEIWRFYTVPAPGEAGGDTWPSDDTSYLHGGGDVWQTPAIDPDLGAILFSTGSPAPHYDGSVRAGDNLFTDSVVALDYRTGQYRWHFQEIHHDIWNYGAHSPVVLFETRNGSSPRKGVYECSEVGWCYFLDRATGQSLSGVQERPAPQEPRQLTAPSQPYPAGDAVVPQCSDPLPGLPTGCLFDPFWETARSIRPGAAGGGAWRPTAFDPRIGYVFVDTSVRDTAYQARAQPFVKGQRYESGSAVQPQGSAYAWKLAAIDSTINHVVWQMDGRGDGGYGALATAGGLIFVGQVDGHLVAYDELTGRQLWQFQTGLGITAPPVSWAADGVQYISVVTGGNAESGPSSLTGDGVWTFALTGGIDEAPAPPPPRVQVGVAVQVDTPPPLVPISSAGG
jgi:alcohol dehydrogenase (cytochrome c)